MKAAVLREFGAIENSPLEIIEVDRPAPGQGEILIRVLACGVCRSNLHMVEGDWAPAMPAFTPIIPGHEVVGEVVELGEDVTEVALGDRVGVQPIYSTCLTCEFCVSGREQLCQSKVITGETINGGYAEYMRADARFAYVLPDGLDPVAAAPLFCPGITAIGSVSKLGLRPGQKVAVFGVGGVGHLVLQLALLTGAEVFAVSRSQHNLDLAAELGAIPIDSSSGDVKAQFQTRGRMDGAVVFAPSDTAIHTAISVTKPGGTIVMGVAGDVGNMHFSFEKNVVGSILGTRQQMREVLELAAAGKIRAECETFPLDEANQALQKLKAGEIRGRGVLIP